MEREATLLVVSLAVCSALCIAFGALAHPLGRFERSGRHAEVLAWRRIWMPLLPAALALVVFAGWALQAADQTDDAVDPILLVAALPGAIILARAVARAVSALFWRGNPLAATVGLLRPTVIIDRSLVEMLDADALAAVRAHELAHARHRDPLQIWLAQLAIDLQWPAPSAPLRFRQWLHSLEVARDEEARESGTSGDALASAIVSVAQLAHDHSRPFASLLGSGEMLRDRVRRLLRPLAPARRHRVALLGTAIAILVASALAVGIIGGDRVLRCVPGIS